jgi:hypothetical protein
MLYEDKILDGRNRYKACLEVGIERKFDQYEGDDPIGLAVSLNMERRHLTESHNPHSAHVPPIADDFLFLATSPQICYRFLRRCPSLFARDSRS